MANPAAVGRSGAPFRLDVERGKVREFARATGSRAPAYLEAERPPVPPTFLTTQFFWQEGEADAWRLVELDQERGLHAEQEYVFPGAPPPAGARLTCRSTITEMYEKEGRRGGTMTFAVMVTEFRDGDGRLVAEARMTGVETGRPPGESSGGSPGAGAASAGAASKTASQAASAPGPEPGGNGLGAASAAAPGNGADQRADRPRDLPAAPPPTTHGPVTRTDFVRYQGASGDMNPIHHDEEFARAAGFPTPFSVGMFQAGLLASWATDWLGAHAVRRYRVRFKEQVWPGDTLTCSGTAVRAYEEDGERRVDVELSCVRQTGGTAVQAWATFVLTGGAA